MIETSMGFSCGFSAPHHSAAQAGQDILRDGGTAIEAMVSAAATIAVTYPHMNGLGGDGFWLIHRRDKPPVGIFAAGPSAALASLAWYADRGVSLSTTGEIPPRGPLAALTVPGTVDGWAQALRLVERPRPLSQLLAPAIAHARDGIAVTANQQRNTALKLEGIRSVAGFAQTYLQDGDVPQRASRFYQPALADTLEQLARHGLRSFYEGEIAARHAQFCATEGSPLRQADFTAYHAQQVTPLQLTTRHGTLFNMTPPTQGAVSLAILGIADHHAPAPLDSPAFHHRLIEAVKQAILWRNSHLGDGTDTRALLSPDTLARMAARIDPNRAAPWPHRPAEGDTIWMGAADRHGTVVSFIQSTFWEYGSGLTCPDTGIAFQNRGAGFSLAAGPNQLAPRKRPFHTLNPALAQLKDGRVMAYGTMGGEGQPQTQAQIFTRYVQCAQGLQRAITAPRWLLGRTWGDASTTLKYEDRFDPALIDALRGAGHICEAMGSFSDNAGHAGAVVSHANGLIEAAFDPRADGAALVA
ncbi:Putative gamma-glutamyltransferase YwrD [Aquimixticola soesokkakensis]|uniref:Putative gamma-glutamyltransferase YwrD n=1 Tax=Aquimixticola soesokkakensis TaxID=1519096 RepID=A0A1Y5SC24_9RHOB|nr:gamma-glutamyltransferase family protein [Aquimixticola soesokkakensis]SLN37344.1 Putative gamma-glutamyltransferase YwrD [Aquimixticola soesokkakensis]